MSEGTMNGCGSNFLPESERSTQSPSATWKLTKGQCTLCGARAAMKHKQAKIAPSSTAAILWPSVFGLLLRSAAAGARVLCMESPGVLLRLEFNSFPRMLLLQQRQANGRQQ